MKKIGFDEGDKANKGQVTVYDNPISNECNEDIITEGEGCGGI